MEAWEKYPRLKADITVFTSKGLKSFMEQNGVLLVFNGVCGKGDIHCNGMKLPIGR